MTQERLRGTGVLVEPHGVLASAEILLSLHTLRRAPPKEYLTHHGWFLFLGLAIWCRCSGPVFISEVSPDS